MAVVGVGTGILDGGGVNLLPPGVARNRGVGSSLLYLTDPNLVTDPPDAVPPVIGNFTPTPGTTINPGDALGVDIQDNLGQIRVEHVWVEFADGNTELVWDGEAFTPFYLALSTRTAITGGYQYSVRNINGWAQGVTLKADAVDQAGNRHTA